MPETSQEALDTATLKPKVRTINGRTIVERDLKDIRDEIREEKGDEAAASNRPGLGLRFQQITPTYR